MFFKRLAFLDFITAMIAASDAPHAGEARSTILPKTGTLDTFVEKFAKTRSSAAVGAESADAGDQVASTDAHTDLDGVLLQHGVSDATAAEFDVFHKSLSPTGQLFATILAKTHGGAFDEELLSIAHAESASAAFSFAWSDLFRGSPDELDNKGDASIAGLRLPLLKGSCIRWIAHAQSVPMGADPTSAIDDVDHILTAANKVRVRRGGGAGENHRQVEAGLGRKGGDDEH